jgi:hypothetical protein
MEVAPQAVGEWNSIHAQLNLSPPRIAELASELEQLRVAAESVRLDMGLDLDPSDFRAALIACRASEAE